MLGAGVLQIATRANQAHLQPLPPHAQWPVADSVTAVYFYADTWHFVIDGGLGPETYPEEACVWRA